MKYINATALVNINDYLVFELLEDSDMSYVGFNGKRVAHSCEKMGSDYSAGFCSDILYMITANNDLVDVTDKHHGWTYACEKHLPIVALPFALNIAERKVSRAYDEWEDKQTEEREDEEVVGVPSDDN